MMKDPEAGRVWGDTAGLGALQTEVTVFSLASQHTPTEPHQGMLILGLRKMPFFLFSLSFPFLPSLTCLLPFLFSISLKPPEISYQKLDPRPHPSQVRKFHR